MDIYGYGFWLPPDHSAQGAVIDHLINILHVFMVILFVGWGIFMAYCLVAFRQRPGHKAIYQPIHAKLSKWIELGVVAFEVFLLIGLSLPAWSRLKTDIPPESDALVVRVIAQQFAWNIHYPGPDGKFGTGKAELMNDATNPLGLDPADPNGADDITTLNQLYIPVDKNVVVKLSSKDVIHSFGVPVLRVKQDAIPGMEIPIWFKAKQTSEPARPFEIACAQLCGIGHSTMRGFVNVMPQADFDAWLAKAGEAEEEFTEDGEEPDFSN